MNPVVCIGATLIDELYFSKETIITGTSNPAIVKKYIGGVMSNISQHIAMLDIPVEYITTLGNDSDGNWVKGVLQSKNVGISNTLFVNESTGKYTSLLNPDGSLFAATCVDICASYLLPEFLETKRKVLLNASIIMSDTNIDEPTLQWLIDFSKQNNKLLIIEPVSVVKARKLSHLNLDGVFMITPNQDEIAPICNSYKSTEPEMIEMLLARHIKNIWLRKGAEGSVFYNAIDTVGLRTTQIKIKDSTGAGDAALAAWVFAYLNNFTPTYCLQAGHTLAYEVLQQQGAVINNLSKSSFIETIHKYYPNAS
jgi:pseudouridine kinase